MLPYCMLKLVEVNATNEVACGMPSHDMHLVDRTQHIINTGGNGATGLLLVLHSGACMGTVASRGVAILLSPDFVGRDARVDVKAEEGRLLRVRRKLSGGFPQRLPKAQCTLCLPGGVCPGHP
jgi:hypothetical protein